MNLKDLYVKALCLGIENEDHEEVLKFVEIFEHTEKEADVCGYCKHRKTEKCPWLNTSLLYAPSCSEYEVKQELVKTL